MVYADTDRFFYYDHDVTSGIACTSKARRQSIREPNLGEDAAGLVGIETTTQVPIGSDTHLRAARPSRQPLHAHATSNPDLGVTIGVGESLRTTRS